MLANTQDMLQMCSSFDASKSTKGASKLRRDLINAEISNLRDLLPLPSSTRQRLSQLQLMALVCVYVRKANYFHQVFRKQEVGMEMPTSNFGFSKALSGFLMMMTQNGKLLYISDNAAEYLGHSMEDLLIHGDSVYDIVDKQDHPAVQAELNRAIPSSSPSSASPPSVHQLHHHHAHHLHQQQSQPQHHHHQHHHHHHPLQQLHSASLTDADQRIFLCRMNVSRNARRQMRFGDQKVVLVQGHFLSFLPLCSRNEPVFLATCTPVAMPETRECVAHGSTSIFTSLHTMDMKFVHLDKNGEFHLGYSRENVQGLSWYQLIHWENIREAQNKHRLITQMDQDRSCILLLRLQARSGAWIWVHVVLQVKENAEGSQQPVIVCTNQVLSEKEASVMQANTWLYHFYTVQSKLQYSLAFESRSAATAGTMTSAPTPYYAPMVPYTPHRQPPPPPPPPPPPHLYPTSHTGEVPLQHPSLFHHHPCPGTTTSLNGSSHQHHQQHHQRHQEHTHHHHSPAGTYHQLPLSVGHPNFSTTKNKIWSDRGLVKQRRFRRRRSSLLRRNISDGNDDGERLVARVHEAGAANGGGVVHAVMMACMPRHSPHKEAVQEEDGWSSPTASAALVAVRVAYQTVPDLYEDMKHDILSEDHRSVSESPPEVPARHTETVAVVPSTGLWSDDLSATIMSSSSSPSPPASFHTSYSNNSWIVRHIGQESVMVTSSLCCCDNAPKLCRWHLASSGPEDAMSSGEDSVMTSPTPRACRIGDEVIGCEACWEWPPFPCCLVQVR